MQSKWNEIENNLYICIEKVEKMLQMLVATMCGNIATYVRMLLLFNDW